MSSATPGAEPTESSAGGPRFLRRRRDLGLVGPGELDDEQAAELVRRSAESSRDDEPVHTASVELDDREPEPEPEVEPEVVETARWAEPAPTAEELSELEARRAEAEAAATAATERVIAQALATGLTDPDEAPAVRRGVLRRKTGYYSPVPARPKAEPGTAGAVNERAQELQLPRKVRRELERATKEMADAAHSAHAAREAAEQAATAHAERAAQAGAAAAEAIQARAAAERAARNEAQRRTVAEQLASETAEQAAVANATAQAALIARTEAEESALRASLEREAAEAHARAQAEAAARAEARAQELATSLEEARAALLEQTKAAMAAQEAAVAAPPTPPTPVAPPTPAAPSAPVAPGGGLGDAPAAQAVPAPKPQAKPAPAAESRIQPEGVPELVELRSPSSSAVVTVLLGIGALVAAGVTVYEAYLDRLTTPPGIAAAAVTLLLVVVVGRAKGSAGRVWLERGVLHVEEGDTHRRFDLGSPTTRVEMVGRPGGRRWKVLFLRKGMAPYEIDARLVDPDEFVTAIKPWRPGLGGR
jgi:hypothetical protein